MGQFTYLTNGSWMFAPNKEHLLDEWINRALLFSDRKPTFFFCKPSSENYASIDRSPMQSYYLRAVGIVYFLIGSKKSIQQKFQKYVPPK